MKGHGNNRLLQGATFLGKARTVQPYCMEVHGVPFVYEQPDYQQGHHIDVEVYRVDLRHMRQSIDELEGHPDWYVRQRVLVDFGTDPKHSSEFDINEVWMYMQPHAAMGDGPYYKSYAKALAYQNLSA